MLDEVAMVLYTFQLECVCSIKINYFSKKWKGLLTSASHQEPRGIPCDHPHQRAFPCSYTQITTYKTHWKLTVNR